MIFLRECVFILLFFLHWRHPTNIESNLPRYRTKMTNSIIRNFGKDSLHHIRRARVEGSGSIYRTWCTGRTFSSVEWHPRSRTPLWPYFLSSCWCPGLPTQTQWPSFINSAHGHFGARLGIYPSGCEQTSCSDLTSGPTSCPVSLCEIVVAQQNV